MDIEFAHGQPLPQCRIHVDTVYTKHYAIQLMTSGSMYFQRNNRPEAHLTMPAFFWTDCKSRYRYGPGATGSWDHHWITFGGKMAEMYYLELLESGAPDGYVLISNVEHTRRAYLDLLQSIHVPTDNFARIHMLNRVLARVDEGKPCNASIEPKIKAIKDAIDSKPEDAYDFQALAHDNGYSYSNFRRLFSECTTAPPQRYLLARRMQKAAERLTQTNESVQSIGDRYGYLDPARFSKAFKKHHGKSPRDYKKSIFGSDSPPGRSRHTGLACD